jgi:CRISPR-associated protein Cmx8
MSKKTTVEEVTLTFDLHELPTAQHRAGLAGLILQIDAMGADGYRRAEKLVPVLNELTATSAKITFTPDSMQGIFNELYAAKLAEVVVATKWPGEAKPKPGAFFVSKKDPKTGEMKEVPGFAYDVVQPQAPALMRHLDGGREAWLELWRQMIWSIPRGGNNVRSRAPFIDLANHRPCGEGATAWSRMVDFHKGVATSRFKTEPISGALMLGAQAVNAEGVPFSGRVDHNLLLHFWQLVVLTFVPQVVNKKDAKVERIGYVLAIPDVADLIEFRAEFPAVLQGLEANDPKHTPPKARLDLPAQAGLEILRRLRDVSQMLAKGKAVREWGDVVRAVETYHMFKLGNNVKLLGFSRVADRAGLVEDYERIAKNHRNPFFRAGLIRSLLLDRPWHWGMIDLFTEYPHHFFLEIEGETPRYLPRFGRDARALFAAHQQEIRGMTPDEMNEDETVKRLGSIVRNLMTSYVNRKAARKLGLDWDDFKIVEKDGKKRKAPPEGRRNDFEEQQRRVCDDAFLQIRSRHDEDFVQFFAGSICAVPHYFDAKAGDLPFVMQILMTPPSRDALAQQARNRDDIKTLAMLALSAYSFNVRKRDPKKEGSPS